ncbi:hypothetical protein GFY24_22945 [Nocardia sp. SYP-A9097]|nr:hypothetical protein [Nocardia sp. SYP-A9097]
MIGANRYQRTEAVAVSDFIPDRELTFRASQVISRQWRAEQRPNRPVLVIDYPVGDITHMMRWASGKYFNDGVDRGYNIVRPDDVRFGGPTRDGLELDGAPWVRRWPPRNNTFVRSRSLTEPVNARAAQAPVGAPARQRLLTVKTGWWKTWTVAVDDETLLKLQAANEQLAGAARKNGGPVVLLPDESFPSAADDHIDNLRTTIGSPEMYIPTGGVSTTISDSRSTVAGPAERAMLSRTGIEVHKVDDSPAWHYLGVKPGIREWWAQP